MGIFADYVDTYGDLGNAFAGAERANGLYVDNNSDLLAQWESNKDKPKFREKYPTKGSYGAWHYDTYGRNEGREMFYHTMVKDPGIGTVYWDRYVDNNSAVNKAWRDAGQPDKASFGERYWNRTGRANGDLVPTRVQGMEGWGQAHWETYGKNEDRILEGAKISVDNNGNAYLSGTNLIGSQALNRYNNVINTFNNAKEGTYKQIVEGLGNQLNSVQLQDLLDYNGEEALSASYQKKLTPWDSSKGAQPLTGGFDASYYRSFTPGGQQAEEQWDAAQSGISIGGISIPDLDIVGRFSPDTYMHWHYTTQGKAAGYRGNEAQYASLSDEYQEYLTDAEYELYRDKVLGGGDETILGKKVSTELTAKEQQVQQQFGSLTTDSLKKAADELVKAKRQERDFDFYRNLEGFDEVLTINETIANSLLGDSGIGGILGFVTNPVKAQESLEKSLASATGIPTFNGVTYNWQKWFDEQLAGNYEKGITVADPLDPNKTYQLTGDFAKRYIDEYLKPRFDSSKSMSEFISTLELQQQDKNVFDVQTALTKLKDIAEIRAQAYLDDVYSKDPLNFNADFYMNPSGNFETDDPKIAKYNEQRDQVAADWETAKRNGSSVVPGTNWTWDQWAYNYGLDVNDKNQFAQLHYQVLGSSKGFDPARDVLTLKDATDYISTKILPEIAAKDIDLADVQFLQFVTPEEFADSVIEGVSPETNKAEWDKMLGTLGIAGEGMGIDEVKQYIADQFRTGNAINIRQSIKYLNEKGKTPTQKELGVEYIQRESDAAPSTSPYATTLYKIFKNAGYQGSEDDFYGSFMTDVDKGEMQLLEQGASEKGLQLGGAYAGLTSDDPFQALSSMSGLFGDTTKTTTTSADSTKTGSISSGSSYFKLLNDEEEPTKSASAQKILGEFTSLFKGFT